MYVPSDCFTVIGLLMALAAHAADMVRAKLSVSRIFFIIIVFIVIFL